MQNIPLPSSIRVSGNAEMSNILAAINHLKSSSYDAKVSFDFSNVDWFSAEMTTFLGMEIRRLQDQGYKVYTTKMRSHIRLILDKNGFTERLLHNPRKEDVFATTIPYVELKSDDVDAINNYISNSVFKKIGNFLTSDTEQRFKQAIFEIADNTHTHSQSNLILMCGQYFPQQRRLAFTIADNGISIPVNVNNSLTIYDDYNSKNDTELINWSMQIGNSTKLVPESGLGLFDIMETMKRLGELTVISNYGYWKMTSEGTRIRRYLCFPLHGTLIHFNFLLEQSAASDFNDSNNLSF